MNYKKSNSLNAKEPYYLKIEKYLKKNGKIVNKSMDYSQNLNKNAYFHKNSKTKRHP